MGKQDQGVQSDRFMVIPRSLVFATKGENVLLIKGAPHKRLWADRYNGVGGHIERGEDVYHAAHREFQEESGLSLTKLWLVGTVVVDAGQAVGILFFVFRGECDGEPVTDSAEGILEWIPISQLPKLPTVEDVPVLLSQSLKRQPGDEPFFGQYFYDEEDRLVMKFYPD